MEYVWDLTNVNVFMAMEDLDVIKVIYFFIKALKSPFCVNGEASIADKCQCFDGWKGELCEISKEYFFILSKEIVKTVLMEYAQMMDLVVACPPICLQLTYHIIMKHSFVLL